MTSKLDVVREVMVSGPIDMERSNKYLTDDFKWTDGDGNEMDKQAYMGLAQVMTAAFPDLEFVRTSLREEGNHVVMTGHFIGTFKNDFDLSAMGLGVIPASGKTIEFPDASNNVEVKAGKIARLEALSGGGIEELLATLGAKMPSE